MKQKNSFGITMGIVLGGKISGRIYVERDLQKRLYTDDGTVGWDGGSETTAPGMGGWLVFMQGDGSMLGDSVSLGLFWRKEHADLFARALGGES